MTNANLVGSILHRATLRGANLLNTDLTSADLTNADLTSADLTNAEITYTTLEGTIISGTILDKDVPDETSLLALRGPQFYAAIGKKGSATNRRDLTQSTGSQDEAAISINIIEDPLTPQNLSMALTALTEFATKLWLISKHRFSDLIEYTQTHNNRFAYEASTVITKVTYNSPFNIDWKVDISAPSVAEAISTTIDAIKQKDERLKKLELKNQAEAQRIEEAEQKAYQIHQMAALEREKQELEFEKRRLEIERERQALIELRLDAQNKQLKDALDLARQAIDIVYPNADVEMRPILFQTVLNNILQMQNVTGLELALPYPRKKRTK
jgi:Pentapeptide repeats (8 copies)